MYSSEVLWSSEATIDDADDNSDSISFVGEVRSFPASSNLNQASVRYFVMIYRE